VPGAVVPGDDGDVGAGDGAPSPMRLAKRAAGASTTATGTGAAARWAASAASTTWKKLVSSAMSPRRFHVRPLREISWSRPTLRSTIHFCSVVISRKRSVPPSARRKVQSGAADNASSGTGWAVSDVGFGVPGVVASRDTPPGITLNTCPQLLHCTGVPAGPTRESSSSYSVAHRLQRTSMTGLDGDDAPADSQSQSAPKAKRHPSGCLVAAVDRRQASRLTRTPW